MIRFVCFERAKVLIYFVLAKHLCLFSHIILWGMVTDIHHGGKKGCLNLLHVVQFLVVSVVGQQLVMCAPLHNAAFMQDANLIGIPDS